MAPGLSPKDFLPAVDLQILLEGLDYTSFSIMKLVERVAAARRQPLALLACPIPSPVCYGWWLASPVCDFVFYERATFPFHQNHIICHELAHILLGHKTASIDEAGARRLLEKCGLAIFSGSANKVLRGEISILLDSLYDDRVLMREMSSLHESLREEEAESLATLLQRELFRQVGLSALTRPSQDQEIRQIVQSLGFDR